MGIFDRSKNTPSTEVDASALAGPAGKLVDKILSVGVDGFGTFDSAQKVADAARARRSDPERVVDDIVGAHTRLVAASGFVTGLGGFVTLPVALPANVAGFYILAARMAAAIATVRGYDVNDPAVRSAVLLSLVGADTQDLLKKAGYSAPSSKLVDIATSKMPAGVVMAVNKGVGFRLLTQASRGVLGKLGRGVPLVGGAVGAGMDAYVLRTIASHVRSEFPIKATLTSLPDAR